jgi:hypothetical protein
VPSLLFKTVFKIQSRNANIFSQMI